MAATTKIAKAIVQFYAASAATTALGLGIEGIRQINKKAKQTSNAENRDLCDFADQSVGWWQNFIQDGLDAIAIGDPKAPAKRVVVTTAQARQVKAKVTNFMLRNEDPDQPYSGCSVPGSEFEMAIGDRNYTVIHSIGVRKVNGTVVPEIRIYANLDSCDIELKKTPTYRSYYELWETLTKRVGEAERILQHGTPVGRAVKYTRTTKETKEI